mgnify:CR=1 FL=1
MIDVDNKLRTDPHDLQQCVERLKSEYSKLSSEVEQLESDKTAQSLELSQINGQFKQINESIEKITHKLNENSINHCVNKTIRDRKNLITNSLKKIAVGTLSVVYAAADKTIEKASNLREGFEDIAAEAQYVNKKKECSSEEKR